jgi:site-specific DNA recombinase
VRRTFELAAQGYGGKRIALILNGEGVKPPKARGWAPSAIRAMLHNPLYRGEIVWNRTQKTVRRGTKGSRRRDESEWLRRPALDLAII